MGGGYLSPNDRWIVRWADEYGETGRTTIKESRIPNYVRSRNYSGDFGQWLPGHIKKSSTRAHGRITILDVWRE